MQTNCIFIPSDFVMHPQILIFSVFNIASFSPYWLQIKFFISPFFYSFTFTINLWHRKFVTADVTALTAMFVNNQHGIQWRGQDFDKNTNILSIHSYMRRGIKIGALKMQFVCISSISAEYMQKIWIFNFPRLCSNMLKVRWVILYRFCSKFHMLSSSAKIVKIVKMWQSYREFKGVNFFWDTVYNVSLVSCWWIRLNNSFSLRDKSIIYYSVISILWNTKHFIISFYANLWLHCCAWPWTPWPWPCIISGLGPDTTGLVNISVLHKINPLKRSGIRWLHFEAFSAIQV